MTGGEPTIQRGLLELVTILKAKGYWLAIETNGVLTPSKDIRYKLDYIATSPKILYSNLYRTQDALKTADEVRIVVDDNENKKIISFCKEIRNRIFSTRYYLSPCEVEGTFNMEKTLEILGELNRKEETNKWKLSIQAHKLANIR
jgi:7-carboxy-7-deazaguanine synthase